MTGTESGGIVFPQQTKTWSGAFEKARSPFFVKINFRFGYSIRDMIFGTIFTAFLR